VILHTLPLDRVRAPPSTQIACVVSCLRSDQIEWNKASVVFVGRLTPSYGGLHLVFSSESYDVSQAAVASCNSGDRLLIAINPHPVQWIPVLNNTTKSSLSSKNSNHEVPQPASLHAGSALLCSEHKSYKNRPTRSCCHGWILLSGFQRTFRWCSSG
jgi:hypothetical protein